MVRPICGSALPRPAADDGSAPLVTLLRTRRARWRRAVALSACLLAAPAAAARDPVPAVPPAPVYEPADTLEGNFLAAYIAGAARDTAAAASYYREAVKGDPRNPELLERAFVALLADGAMPEAFRVAERLTARDDANGLAHLALGVKSLKARQYGVAR